MLHLGVTSIFVCFLTLESVRSASLGLESCCTEKSVGGVIYFLVSQDSSVVNMYGCSKDCVYVSMDDPTGQQYCFAPGSMEVICLNDTAYPPSPSMYPPSPSMYPPETMPTMYPPSPSSMSPSPSSMAPSPSSTVPSPATTGGSDGGSVPSNAEFCQVDSDHTMCKYEGPSDTCSAQTIYRELSADAKQAILDKHNELRRKVAKGEETDGAPGPQPAASNMRKLVWNNELEAVAQRWADQCQFGHDSSRNKLDGTAVGQNAYWGGSSVESEEAAVQAGMINAAQAWYDEVSDPGFDSGSISPYVFSSGTGHYTQVVWADTEELGCGMVYYKGSSWYETLIVCNYAISGNWMGGEMYKSGDACSSCPDGYTCDDGLCAAP